jgi:cholesterol oxidase
MNTDTHFDVLIIGSGFGGSVSALRLVEKGYRVAVLEAGRRFEDKGFPKTSWRIHKFLYAPKLGLKGIQRIHALPDVLVLAGAGVGGGSLVYANTLYLPPDSYFNDEQWKEITDWKSELLPWYEVASKMLGVVDNPYFSPSDQAMKEAAIEMGVGHTFRLAPLGIYFGDGPGVKAPDPFFGGKGPARNGCQLCGACMSGCRFNAKNTLPKNYLGLSEGAGAQVFPEHTVISIEESSDKSWRIVAKKSGSWLGRERVFTADQVIVAAGTYNSQKLLHTMKASGKLPKLSSALGNLSRTNSESLTGALMPSVETDFSQGPAITSSFFPDESTHIEPVRYGKGSNVMGLIQTIMTDGSLPKARRKQWLFKFLKRPTLVFKFLNVRRWSQRAVIALVMQNVDSALSLRVRKTIFGWRLTSHNNSENPNATYIPAANQVSTLIAKRYGGVAAGHVGDLIGAPFTAHFVGGCVIGDSEQSGVIDPYHRVWNYPSLHIVDGSSITANLGVNPSLTITAQAERAMSMWPNKGEKDFRPHQGAEYQHVNPQKPVQPVVPQSAQIYR